MAGKGKIKLQDAVDDYDWIRCVTCRKVFPKREYIQHRREAHKKVNNNNTDATLAGTDRSKAQLAAAATSSNARRRKDRTKREILVVTLSSGDEDDGEVNNEEDDRSEQYSHDESMPVPEESINSVSRREGANVTTTETCSQSTNVFIVEDYEKDGRDSESDRRSDAFVRTNSAENNNGNSEPEIVTIDDDEDSADHDTGALSTGVPDQVLDNENSDIVATVLPPPVSFTTMETLRANSTVEEQSVAVTRRPTVIRVSKKYAVEGNKDLSGQAVDKLVDSSSFRDNNNCYEKENSIRTCKEYGAMEPEEDKDATNFDHHSKKLKLDFKRDKRKQKRRAVKLKDGSDGSEGNGNSHRKENLLTEPTKSTKKKKRHLEELAKVSELQSNTGCFKNSAHKAINRRQYCVKNVTDICEESSLEKRRVVVVLGRLSEDKPSTKEVTKLQKIVHRDSDSSSVPRKIRKPRQPPVPLIQDIQPYVRRAAASKPIRYEEHFCPYCSKVFTHYKVAEAHIKKHEDGLIKSKKQQPVGAERIKPLLSKPPVVPTSSASTTGKLQLATEVVKPKRKRCSHCPLWLDDTQMPAHMKLHTKSKRFKCKNCKRGFSSLSGKRQHENKCRQLSLVFLPNGEWRQVAVKAPGGSPVITSLHPPISKRRIAKSKNKSASGIRNGFRSSRRAKGRIQKLEVAKTTGDQILSNQKTDDAVREPPKAAVREPLSEKRHELTATGTVKRSGDQPVTSLLPPKLAKSDLLADYSSAVGKRVISLLSQLDEMKAKVARREITPVSNKLTSNQSCWIVKLHGKKSISCSLFTRSTEFTKNTADSKDNKSVRKYSAAEGITCQFCKDKLLPVDYLHHVLQHEDCTATTCPVCLKIFLHSGLYYHHMKTLHGLEHSSKIPSEEDNQAASPVHCRSQKTCFSDSSSKCMNDRNTNDELSTEDKPGKCSNGQRDSIVNDSNDSHSNANTRRCESVCSQSLHWKKTFVKLSSCTT